MKKIDPQIWLITGVSGGLGKALAIEAIEQGDFVIGTVKNKEDALAFEKQFQDRSKAFLLDLSKGEEMDAVVKNILNEFGSIDILVNNAGYGLVGYIEEASEEEVRRQMDVNFFGALRLTQTVLPYMRAKRSGHIIQVSSRLGVVAAPGFGLYAASKFALEGLSEALAGEIAPFGIKLTIAEPGPMRTEFFGRSPVYTKRNIADYHNANGNVRETSRNRHGKQDGDPQKVARAIVKITREENPPLRLPLTEATLQALKQKVNEYRTLMEEWEAIALDTKIEEVV